MATIEEGFCYGDSDCPEKQYCYHVSKACVDYTQCSRYNRDENREIKARHPSQCGPCLSGYTAEKLSTGEVALLCRKTHVQQEIPEAGRLNNSTIIYITIPILLILLLILLGSMIAIYFKRRSSRQQGRNSICPVAPTAPPSENSPFIDEEAATSLVPFNNNKNLKDKNNLVRAAGYSPPSWVQPNPNYDNDVNDASVDMVERVQSTIEFPADDETNNWAPEQLIIQVANGGLVGREMEQMENNVNPISVETSSNPSSSNVNDDDSNSNSQNNTESNNAQSSRERVRTSNILISQKISMNVNLINGDC